MKKLYLAIFIMLIALPGVFGQLQFGVKGGIVSSSSNLKEKVPVDETGLGYDQLKVEAQDAKVGFQAGLFGRLSIAALYVQPELMFTSTSSRVKVSQLDSENPGEAVSQVKEQEFKKIDIPIMAGWKFGPARIQAGPVGSIILDQESAIEAATKYNETFNGASWGYQVGVGLDLLNTLTLDAKYEGSLSKLGESVQIGNQSFDINNRTNQFIVTVGLFF
jgi:hypothetical protein